MANFSGRDGAVSYGTDAATGVLTLTGQPTNGQTVTIGGKVYTFQTTLTEADGNVLIGGSASASLDNLIAAINRSPAGAGTQYAAATVVHPAVTAAAGAGDTMDVTAKVRGTGGNSIGTTETLTNGSFGNATLTGGASATCGELRQWSLGMQADLVEDTVKGDALRTYKPDLPTGRGTFECWVDYGDTAQAAAIDDINTTGQAAVQVAFTVASGKTLTADAIATSYNVTSPEGGGRSTVGFQVTLTSLPTVAWV